MGQATAEDGTLDDVRWSMAVRLFLPFERVLEGVLLHPWLEVEWRALAARLFPELAGTSLETATWRERLRALLTPEEVVALTLLGAEWPLDQIDFALTEQS